MLVTAAEVWRWWAYVSWFALFATGIIITEASGVLNQFPGRLPPSFQVSFGVYNICINFDLAPANMVLPVLYALTLLIWLPYFAVLHMRVNAEHQAGLLDDRLKGFLMWSYKFELFTVVCFSMIWAVSPETDLESSYFKASLILHTVPYLFLQIGLAMLAISHSVYQLKTGYWEARHKGFGKLVKYILPAYCTAFVFNVCINITISLVCLYNVPWTPPGWLIKIFQPLSASVFVLGLFIPTIKETIALFCFPGQLKLVAVQMRMVGTIENNEFEPVTSKEDDEEKAEVARASDAELGAPNRSE